MRTSFLLLSKDFQMPFDISRAPNPTPIAAYVCTEGGASVARSVLEAGVGHVAELHGGGLSGAARLCDTANTPEIILAEIGNIPVEMACECIAEICSNGSDVIVLGEQTDITTYRALIKAGALEYFTLPATAEEILAVERSIPAHRQTPAVAASRCTSIAVVGSNGGVGASLLAQNVAYYAASAKGGNKRTALIDADLQFGSQAIDLDREETIGLFEALMSPDRIDTTFIAATMDHLSANLSMYSCQLAAGQDAQDYNANLPHLYAPLHAEFDMIITDLPRAQLLQNPAVAGEFDAVLLVIPAGFSGACAARRLIEVLGTHAPDLKIIPVLSELRGDAKLSMRDLSDAIGAPIKAALPRSDTPLMRAHRAARPLVAFQPKGAYAKSVQMLWGAAQAQSSEPPRRSFLKRMFS